MEKHQKSGETATKQKAPKALKSIYEDGPTAAQYWEAGNSNDLPLLVLSQRNNYADTSLAFGGMLEMEPMNTWWGNTFHPGAGPGHVTGKNDYGHGVGIGLSAANIDVMANLNKWIQAFVQTQGTTQGVGLESAFVNIGNLADSPFYATAGLSRVRFGMFPGAPWAASITQGIFRPGHVLNATLGYSKGPIDAYLSYIPDDSSHKASMMASAFYNGSFGDSGVTYTADAGYMNNMSVDGSAVANAMQTQDGGNAAAINADVSVGYEHANLSGGWIQTLNNLKVTNNAKAHTWWTQASYTAHAFARDFIFAVSYNQSQNTQQVAMPLMGDINHGPSLYGSKRGVLTYVDTQLFPNVNTGLEYAWLETYNDKDTNAVTLYTAFYF